jgi:hypothetical protein
MTLTPPPPHMMRILKAAETDRTLARLMANSFNDPKAIAPWYYDPVEADRFLSERAQAA